MRAGRSLAIIDLQHSMATYPCRIRKYRKALQLSQQEFAQLLGMRSQGQIADIEAGRKRPSAAIAFACQIVCIESAHDLFPQMHAELEQALLANAIALHATLHASPRRSATARQLAALINRLKQTP